jgi:hypothetical protein
MVSAKDIGSSLGYAVTVIIVFSFLWPYLPPSLATTMRPVVAYGVEAIVIGTAAVGLYLLSKTGGF